MSTKSERKGIDHQSKKFFGKTWVWIGLIVLSLVLVYSNSLKNDFVWDDYDQIVNNPYVKSWKSISLYFKTDVWKLSPRCEKSGYYRPLLGVSFIIDY